MSRRSGSSPGERAALRADEREIAKAVGRAIRALRAERTVTEVVGDEAIDLGTWSRWEKGKNLPTIANLRRLSSLLGTTTAGLLSVANRGLPIVHVPMVTLRQAADLDPWPKAPRLCPVPVLWPGLANTPAGHLALVIVGKKESAEGTPIPPGAAVLVEKEPARRIAALSADRACYVVFAGQGDTGGARIGSARLDRNGGDPAANVLLTPFDGGGEVVVPVPDRDALVEVVRGLVLYVLLPAPGVDIAVEGDKHEARARRGDMELIP